MSRNRWRSWRRQLRTISWDVRQNGRVNGKKLWLSSTPTIARLQAYTPATSYISSVHIPKNPVASSANVLPPKNTYTISSVSAPQSAGGTMTPYVAGSSSFCARPPIRLELPSFDGAGDTADVLNFISSVRTSSASSPSPRNLEFNVEWTCSELVEGRENKGYWLEVFQRGIYGWFQIPDSRSRSLVQQPWQCLRDFAYDYRALCLKWKPEISEEELVNRILNNINLRVAGCLRWTVNTV